ncbi:MAG: hypothetical protein M1365_00285 [Actinobacteria bacterium]|nr:hypothetical protein [Actinomycetota bacterium]
MFARIGVGVGTGKIRIEQDLKPGMSYDLPPFTVINTGDEDSRYSVSVSRLEGQKEFFPKKEWFAFSPSAFSLKPGKAQVVKVRLNLPVRAEPGKYFAYLEGFPVAKEQDKGGALIGIAAASKLYFTVVPANIFEGIYYKILYFWQNNQPFTGIFAVALVVLVVWRYLKQFLNIQINFKKKEESSLRRSRLERIRSEKNSDE